MSGSTEYPINHPESLIIENVDLIKSNSKSLLKFTMPPKDRFIIEYLSSRTTRLIRELLMADYILSASVKNNSNAPFEYRYPKLLTKYKELVHAKMYSSFIRDEVKRNRK